MCPRTKRKCKRGKTSAQKLVVLGFEKSTFMQSNPSLSRKGRGIHVFLEEPNLNNCPYNLVYYTAS